MVFRATREVFTPSLVTVLVVALVNVPIFALTGIEGKMFQPMAFTVVAALLGALLFSATFVPAAVAIFVRGRIDEDEGRVMASAHRGYARVLRAAQRRPWVSLGGAGLLVGSSVLLALRMGAEFVPSLDEGDIALHALRIPGTGLDQSIDMQKQVEMAVRQFPEVERVFSKIGTAEVANDPMPPSVADTFVMVRHRDAWPDPSKTKPQLLAEIDAAVQQVPGNNYEFTQPIQMRFNELISGVRAELAIKVFGDDFDTLVDVGRAIEAAVNTVPGAADVELEQATGLPVLSVEVDRTALSRYGLHVADVQSVLRVAIGGETAGQVFDGDRRFDIVVRLPEDIRTDLRALGRLPIPLPDLEQHDDDRLPASFDPLTSLASHGRTWVPLTEVAKIVVAPGVNQVNRENGKRRVVVTSNVRGRDLGSFVSDVQAAVRERVAVPPGYWLDYGGTFEQLESAVGQITSARSADAAADLRSALHDLRFGEGRSARVLRSAARVDRRRACAVAARHSVLDIGWRRLHHAVRRRGAHRSGHGELRERLRRGGTPLDTAVAEGALTRLRPILMIALVASLGFLPMALNTGAGAEVQRPLATVVIGGILSSTLLTLVVLPVLYGLAYTGFHGSKSDDETEGHDAV